MTRHQLENFILYLQKENWLVFGPKKNTDETTENKTKNISPYISAHNPPQAPPVKGTNNSPESQKRQELIFIDQVEKPEDLVLDDRLPFYPWKRFFIPEKETLFEYKETDLKSPSPRSSFGEAGQPPFKGGIDKIALIGINILDLKAVNLYDQVFERDPYYQRRRRNTLIVGHSVVPQIEDPSTRSGQANLFEQQFEEDILEHLPFDIFLAATGHNSPHPPLNLRGGAQIPPLGTRGGKPASPAKRGEGELVPITYKIFSGSIKGQRILEHFGYRNYEHIQFSGPIKEGLPDKQMELLRDKLKNHHNQKIWDELGKRCIECGKCTIACPTCFCFRVNDAPELKKGAGARERCWDSCYYAEFSEVSGSHPAQRGLSQAQLGHKFLSNTASRIHFWYFHKFARIPDEFNFMGCVGCHRCAKVCPVNIDIAEVLKEIEKS